jgi:hypothetical protein
MWADGATKLGYKWKIGNGRKIRFWEDNWLRSSNLAIQYWELYVIVDEKTCTIADLWDCRNLKCTFRRTMDDRLYIMRMEIVQLASTIAYNAENIIV